MIHLRYFCERPLVGNQSFVMISLQENLEQQFCLHGTKTAFLLIIFGNRKRWNRGIVNGMQHLGISRTERVFHLFYLFHPES